MTIYLLADTRLTVIDRDGNSCVRCGRKREEIHHRYRRGMGGSTDPMIHNPANLICLCAEHHQSAESKRTKAREVEGLCVPTLDRAPVTPVLTLTGWRLPTVAGTWLQVCQTYQASNVDDAMMTAWRIGLIGGTSDHL
jgi:hypothetical protein